jgi:hypothetical protein
MIVVLFLISFWMFIFLELDVVVGFLGDLSFILV